MDIVLPNMDNPRRQQNYDEVSHRTYDCPTCHEQVHGNRGYYVEHTTAVIDRYGSPRKMLCPSSNSKIKVELKTIVMSGTCEVCDSETEYKLTEEYAGSLKVEGGVLEVPCVVCNGRTEATCVHCGNTIAQLEGVWVHDVNSENDCPGQILAEATDDNEDLDLDDEFFDPAPKEPTHAEPLPGTEKKNDLNMVVVHDEFTIEERDDEESSQDHQEV